jgi:hypothetical protein
MTTETYDTHIVADHGLVGYVSQIQKTVEQPDVIKESTASRFCYVFETVGTAPGGLPLRVIVDYADTNIMKGGIPGKVLTAYPASPDRRSKVGRLIYPTNTTTVRP